MDYAPHRGSSKMDFEELYSLCMAKYTVEKSYCESLIIRAD